MQLDWIPPQKSPPLVDLTRDKGKAFYGSLTVIRPRASRVQEDANAEGLRCGGASHARHQRYRTGRKGLHDKISAVHTVKEFSVLFINHVLFLNLFFLSPLLS
jgi:hypothetical protein